MYVSLERIYAGHALALSTNHKGTCIMNILVKTVNSAEWSSV